MKSSKPKPKPKLLTLTLKSRLIEKPDETEMWIDLIIIAQMINNEYVKNLYNESTELLKILTSMQKQFSS